MPPRPANPSAIRLADMQGMATPKHTPEGRGYLSTLNYWSHKNDFWTEVSDQNGCGSVIKDLWQSNATASGPAVELMGTAYEEYLFRDEALRVLKEHPPSTPLLLFYAAHVGHFPLQVPQEAFLATKLEQGVGDVSSCAGAHGRSQTAFVAPWAAFSQRCPCRRLDRRGVAGLQREHRRLLLPPAVPRDGEPAGWRGRGDHGRVRLEGHVGAHAYGLLQREWAA